jgi:hypothetical protein
MADVGTLATNLEYATMCAGFAAAGTFGGGKVDRESIVIRAVEALVKRECNATGEALTIANEEYSIPRPVVQDDIIIRPVRSLMLRRAPLSAFASLRIVTERSPTDGSVTATSTVPPNVYAVELATGIIRILDWILIEAWPYYGFPAGTMNMLANYSTLAAASGDLDLMRTVCFMAAARIFNQFKNNQWNVSSITMDGMSTSYLDCHLTKQELGMLRGLKRGVFPSATR